MGQQREYGKDPRKVFIENLAPKTSTDDIEKQISCSGTIAIERIAIHSGQTGAIGFVTFCDIAGAKEALMNDLKNGLSIGGKRVVLQVAKEVQKIVNDSLNKDNAY